ncbi:MAG: NAD(P)-binding protein [Arcobacter sp.]|nr:NAD(P)-binding protein [Arcobacter sp.]
MNKYDLAIIGSGMGGAMIASLNKHRYPIIFEKDTNLGGSAGTFKRKGKFYNAGATTFVGYEEGHIVKDIFTKADFKPSLQKSEIAIRIIQKDKTLDRVKNFDEFLENINKVYPNKNNKIFWTKIKELDEKFWTLKKIYYAKYSFASYKKTLNFLAELFSVFGFDSLKSAKSFIKQTLGDISNEYQNFIDAQLLITLQTKSEDISLLSLALGLSYPFHDVFYVNGGMGSLFDGLLKDMEVKKKEEILKIIKEGNLYRLISSKNEYISSNVILNSSIYDSASLFEDENIKKYYESFSFYNQSAFLININLKKRDDFLHHYQIILERNIPNCISNSFFISFSHKEDEIMSKESYSISISSHTRADFWKNLSKEKYKKQKRITQDFIINEFLKHFENIKKEDIIDVFSGTSKTFKKYINRYNCGGRAITMKNILQTPSCKTPFNGLYNIGDSVFAGQGWPGVAIGVDVLNKELNYENKNL